MAGLCWAASLIAAQVWTWQIPVAAAATLAAALFASVAVLVLAATSRRGYRRTRLDGIGGLGLVVLDIAMLAAVFLLAPTLVWPMAAAVLVSVARICLTRYALPAA